MQYIHANGGTMATSKTATLSFRIDPVLKNASRIAAKQEQRSIANMIEVLIRAYCDMHGIELTAWSDEKTRGGH
jgi:hypothetical protein